MLKLEKLAFWITLITFPLPLAMRLESGYRIYLFEVPLWAVYFFWAFRLGLRDQRLHFTKFDFFFLLFLVWLLVSIAYNNAWDTGANNWWFWIKAFLVGFYLRHNLNRLYPLSAIVTFLVVTIALESALGLLQSITQSSIGAVQQYFGQEMEHISIYKAGMMNLLRVQGTFKHSNILGNWIVMLLPLVVAKALMSTSRARLFYWICAVTTGIALVLTLSRGNWGAAVFGMLVMFNATGVLTFKRVNWARLLFSALLAGIFLVTLIFTYAAEIALFSEALSQRIEMLPGSRSETIRYTLLLASSELIAENPVLGVGLGRSNELLHYTEYEIRDRFSATVHNIFMIIATEGGVPACLLFLLAIWQPLQHIYRLARVKREASSEAVGVVAAGMVGGYSAILFAMLWYTGMIEQAELPLILTFFHLALGLRAEQKAVAPDAALMPQPEGRWRLASTVSL
ncbi:MAG: O-antigen ligase family protein [candidate division KSB1 bacterium]|nr:O-antigen ligase family protein [candidate division KSB1 bacterium]